MLLRQRADAKRASKEGLAPLHYSSRQAPLLLWWWRWRRWDCRPAAPHKYNDLYAGPHRVRRSSHRVEGVARPTLPRRHVAVALGGGGGSRRDHGRTAQGEGREGARSRRDLARISRVSRAHLGETSRVSRAISRLSRRDLARISGISRAYLARISQPNALREDGSGALHYASISGHTGCASRRIKPRNSRGRTDGVCARCRCVSALLDAGAEPSLRRPTDGATPLHMAAQEIYAEINAEISA